MEGCYEVYYGGEVCGRLTVGKKGAMLEFSLDCEAVSESVLRLYCKSGGIFRPLGVCVPEGGRLGLKKCLSKCALADLGIAEIEAWCIQESRPEETKAGTWMPVDDPAYILPGGETPSLPALWSRKRTA